MRVFLCVSFPLAAPMQTDPTSGTTGAKITLEDRRCKTSVLQQNYSWLGYATGFDTAANINIKINDTVPNPLQLPLPSWRGILIRMTVILTSINNKWTHQTNCYCSTIDNARCFNPNKGRRRCCDLQVVITVPARHLPVTQAQGQWGRLGSFLRPAIRPHTSCRRLRTAGWVHWRAI